jgi:hypothetical protein
MLFLTQCSLSGLVKKIEVWRERKVIKVKLRWPQIQIQLIVKKRCETNEAN